ncbi:UDP-N-acetylglucosamine 1-carboxyvinyltransferase [Clostridium septicum]|uniref:UDP-N-acetylglucosamine 1-carboxyvinyltransferase n=1 Tax=Clostridium septicum TaxID=1504 RepID=A0A9N7PKP8_CLOSE|nr:UDP-N-acetylglucosamine 1-carboxyvinyltransferase [Clostridium septicum]AYE34287.1 UDP-N-acetylglucosamine 1-carboxyvinyltransferase [Clostridium septicum]MDU1313312.1 UDP-N-acetylglucosamine 1-carboxyvinyltransferase [Clostridium septicum]QAS59681.1 UDP-N-acetylglucosamine 1-carboxyvinyltransferase [Clostridium septicum]UEC21075.1 UDP-N-acetylglucosamine 1-carboxyvinyltransferase [Clostridium septicum]USS00876.1 UDP-N-acetylglucosamine 1-carboxyvinyltransferase [Clostridium septicum]
MEKLVINGGRALKGSVDINGAKNAAVAILPAAIMASEGKCIIDNVPDIEDVHCLERILKSLGCTVNKVDNNTLEIDATDVHSVNACTEDVRRMRASYYFIGALLSRFGKARVELPGGCPIGVRPIDQHIKGFEALGANVIVENGAVIIEAEHLHSANIFFDVVSVGATINVMIAATLADGTTVLENVAKEPHVVDVANFLNSMGADIKGAGTDVIRIKGVEKLVGCNYSVIPDQIEAGTFMIAAVATKGDVTIKNVIPKHLESITAKLTEMGANVEEGDDSVRVYVDGSLKGINVKTTPYPGFPTDVQQPMSALLSIVPGNSLIVESIWENRHKHTEELNKMGANINVDGRTAAISGVDRLVGARVRATDLRAGAAMVIAGLIAEGKTEIIEIEHIDRGYPNIEFKFTALGADITREAE